MSSKLRLLLQCSIVILSVVCISYGFARGEVTTVLNKAKNVCFECIGLG